MATSDNEQVQARTPQSPVVLDDVGETLLREAAEASNGASAVTLTPGTGRAMMQTLVAARAGAVVGPQHWNGPASLHVLRGSATIAGIEGTLRAGTWASVPRTDAELRAEEDLVALLTVLPDGG